jgi:hypothetical protein
MVMRRAYRAALAVCSVLTVAGVVVAGAAPGASAGVGRARAPLGGELVGVSCTSATSCMAIGPEGPHGLLADHWNGARWSVIPIPKPAGIGGGLSGISCPGPASCMAVGVFANAHVSAPLAEHWNGTAWSPSLLPKAGFPAPELFGVSCATTNSCAAVGCNVDGDFCSATVAYEWNGTAWRPEPTPPGTGELRSVSCTAPSDCMAVGDGSKGTLAERWNGHAWSIVPSPNPKNRGFLGLDGVSCLPAGCEAVGSYAAFGPGGILTLAEHWDGHTWSIQHTPNPPGGGLVGLGGVSCSAATACTAVGNYDNSTGQTLATALRWNGTAWALQSPANPHTQPFTVVTLAAVSCPAAASCTTAGYNVYGSEGATQALAEGWNGTGWTIEPTPGPAQ